MVRDNKLPRGCTVSYKGKPHMYLGESRFLKGKHLVARQVKGNIVLTAIKTTEFEPTVATFFNFDLSAEQETKLANF